MLCGGISFLIISRLQTHTIKTYCCSCRLGKGFFFIPTLLVLIVWRNWFWFSSPHTHNWLANIVILSFHAFFGNICCFLIEQCNKSPIHQTLPHIQLPDDPAKKREKKKNLWIDPEMTHDFSRIRKLKFSFWLFDFEHFIPFRLVWLITWSVSVSTGFLASSDCRSHLRARVMWCRRRPRKTQFPLSSITLLCHGARLHLSSSTSVQLNIVSCCIVNFLVRSILITFRSIAVAVASCAVIPLITHIY